MFGLWGRKKESKKSRYFKVALTEKDLTKEMVQRIERLMGTEFGVYVKDLTLTSELLFLEENVHVGR